MRMDLEIECVFCNAGQLCVTVVNEDSFDMECNNCTVKAEVSGYDA